MKINIQKIAYRAIPLLTAFVILVASVAVPARASVSDLRSIYDGNLTNAESNALANITPDDVNNAGLGTYYLCKSLPWLYEQAGIDVEFQGGWLSSQGAIAEIFYQPSGSSFWQVRPKTYGTDAQKYFLTQFTGLRGGRVRFQSASAVTYDNFDWFVGDIFIGYDNSTSKVNYVAMYQGRDFLEFATYVDTGVNTVGYSEMRDVFSRTYNYYAVIRPQTLSGEWNVINYNDFTGNMYVDGANDIITLELPAYLCGVQVNDERGETMLPGQSDGQIIVNPANLGGAGVYFPGSYITYTVLDLSNIPNGSTFMSSGSLHMDFTSSSNYDDYAGGIVYFGMQYYDADFNIIGGQTHEIAEFYLQRNINDFTWSGSVTVDAPNNAVYCVYYGRFLCEEVVSLGDVSIAFTFNTTSLQMSISSLYRQEEQTGKQNELLDQILTGTPEQNEIAGGVAGNLNNSSDAMQGAMGELDSLGDQLSSVNKPDVDSMNVSLDALVPYQAMLAYTSPIQVLWENPTLLGMLSIVVTLVIVSWVFFGKKG